MAKPPVFRKAGIHGGGSCRGRRRSRARSCAGCGIAPNGHNWILAGAKGRDRFPAMMATIQAVIRMEARLLTFQRKALGFQWSSERGSGSGLQIHIVLHADAPGKEAVEEDV
jgi:hypothetical protein